MSLWLLCDKVDLTQCIVLFISKLGGMKQRAIKRTTANLCELLLKESPTREERKASFCYDDDTHKSFAFCSSVPYYPPIHYQ